MLTTTAYADKLTAQAQVRVDAYLNRVDTQNQLKAHDQHDSYVTAYNDVLRDPTRYRNLALAQPPQTYMVGETAWHGLSACETSDFTDWLATVRPDLTPTLSLIRHSPLGQVEPNFIHTDCDMGDWTAILYLTQKPDAQDGTDFWRHRWSGAIASCAETNTDAMTEGLAWRDASQWALRLHVAAAWNRAVIFPASYFHSRAIFENYGEGDDARLTQIVFCKGALACLR